MMKKIIYIAALVIGPCFGFAQMKELSAPKVDTATAIGKQNQVTIYPNPSTGIVRVNFPASKNMNKNSLIVFSRTGEPVYVLKNMNANNMQLDLGFLQPGIYQVIVGSGEGQSAQKIAIVR